MTSVLIYLFSWILTRRLSSGYSQLTEEQYSTDVECYLSPFPLNTTCPISHVIALQNIIAGSKLRSTNCSTEVSANCCSSTPDSCEFDFPVDDLNYYDVCNGRQSCTPRVQSELTTDGNCSQAIYLDLTNYMFFDYYCIPETRIGTMQDGLTLTDVNSALYLMNQGYPVSNISSSIVEQTCSVETDDCNSQIHVYTIERILATKLNESCTTDQSLSISTGDGTVLVNWTCSDNTYTLSDIVTSHTYVIVTLSNTLTIDLGRFWIGFSATGNVTISCPTVERLHCIPETTTILTTTTTPTTTTTTTPSTTSATSTTTTTTPTTTPTTTSTTATPTTTTTITPTTTTTTITTPTTTTTTATPTTTTTTTPTPTTTTTPTTITTTTPTTTTTTMPTTTTTPPTSTTTTTPSTTTTTSSTRATSTQTEEPSSENDDNLTVILLIVVIGLLVLVLCFSIVACILSRSKNHKQAKQADIERTNVTATTGNHLSGLDKTVPVTEPETVPVTEHETVPVSEPKTVHVSKPETVRVSETETIRVSEPETVSVTQRDRPFIKVEKPYSDVSSAHSHVTVPLCILPSEDQHQTSSVIQPASYSSSETQERHMSPTRKEESSLDALNGQELETKLEHQLVLQVPDNKTHQNNENQIDNSRDTGSVLNDNDELITTRRKHVRKKSSKKHRTTGRSNLISSYFTDKTVEPSLVPVPIAETSKHEHNAIENNFDIQTVDSDSKNPLENVTHDLQNREVHPQYLYPTKTDTRNVTNYLQKSNSHLGNEDKPQPGTNTVIKDLQMPIDQLGVNDTQYEYPTNVKKYSGKSNRQLRTTGSQYPDTNCHTMIEVTHHTHRKKTLRKASSENDRPRNRKRGKSEDISKYEKLYRIVQCSSVGRRADLDDKVHRLNIAHGQRRRVNRSNSKVYPGVDYTQQTDDLDASERQSTAI